MKSYLLTPQGHCIQALDVTEPTQDLHEYSVRVREDGKEGTWLIDGTSWGVIPSKPDGIRLFYPLSLRMEAQKYLRQLTGAPSE